MTFIEFTIEQCGPKWVIARRTKNNLLRFANHTFLTQKRFNAIKDQFEALTGQTAPGR